MKALTLFFALFALTAMTTYAQISESTKLAQFRAALANHSSSPNYVVVRVKNLNTGQVKELCTEAPFLEGAVQFETGRAYVSGAEFAGRYFEFANKKALDNVQFDLYTSAELARFAQTLDLPALVRRVQAGQLVQQTFRNGRKEQTMFAHLLFDRGVLMQRGCLVGTVCTLTYYR